MSDPVNTLVHREAIRELIARIGRNLDAKKFDDVVASFSTQGSYTVRAYSAPIRSTWTRYLSRATVPKRTRRSPFFVQTLEVRVNYLLSGTTAINSYTAEIIG